MSNINHPLSVTIYLHLSNKIAIPVILRTILSPPTLSTHQLRIWTAGFLFEITDLEVGTDSSTKTSVRNYHSSFRNNAEEHSSLKIEHNYYLLCTYIVVYTRVLTQDPDCCVEDLVGKLGSN